MSFDVAADGYDRFMGRWSVPLAERFLDQAGVRVADHVLDVGCGPGALTAALTRRLGSAAVTAVDPSESFVAALRTRLPEVDARVAAAENLPFTDASFDVTLAQLVVHFMTDPEEGLREMGRVTRPGGTVGACVWDMAGGRSPVSAFWRAVREVDPTAPDESERAGVADGQLVALFRRAGFGHVEQATLSVRSSFPDAESWWYPFTLGVGPAGAYVAGLDLEHREALRRRCLERLPAAPFEVEAGAWVATARR